MLDKIWYFIIIISVIYGVATGNIENVTKAFSTSGEDTVKICISLLGTMCFWMGMMEIITKSKLIDKVNSLFSPIINILFKDLKHNKEVINAIILNLSANFLGLGNAATPFGIEAMHQMNKVNDKKDTLNDDMIMFLILNTTCFQLLPTSIFAYRMSYGSTNVGIVFIPILLSTLFTTISGIIIAKIFKRYNKC
ncbi:nucleoside recognition domain-containing protein [uncultured Anaerofustis sp.]|uniref:nucleoside recognition domain-containing protein n=1 Tax=uncultured Anaerofustis sp. TaxID=904996 RepID=UPI0025F2DFC7|nr:nucleoside recognition domain-containing protein [uncultured Anaerofustis sp.]